MLSGLQGGQAAALRSDPDVDPHSSTVAQRRVPQVLGVVWVSGPGFGWVCLWVSVQQQLGALDRPRGFQLLPWLSHSRRAKKA